MSLSREEVEPGLVATLDTDSLCQDQRVQRVGGKEPFRSGPYLCMQVKNGIALWLPLTSRKDKRGIRLEVERRWRVGGNYGWQRTDCYVQDARRPFVGPVDSFVAAAQTESLADSQQRAYVSDEGLAAVKAEMMKYGDVPLTSMVVPTELTGEPEAYSACGDQP